MIDRQRLSKAMDQVTIRRADIGDLDLLLKFEQAIIETERPFDSTIRSGDNVHYYDLKAMLSSPDVFIVVAELASEIIASGYARIERSTPYLKHDKHSYLGFMYVVPEHRGKGVNSKVVAALEAWSISQGVAEMRLEVYALNTPAIKAYEKAGYTPLLLEMRKSIKIG
jgi:GNAT superfamily N-acetyltransferase